MARDLMDDLSDLAEAHPELTGPEFQRATQIFALSRYEDASPLVSFADIARELEIQLRQVFLEVMR